MAGREPSATVVDANAANDGSEPAKYLCILQREQSLSTYFDLARNARIWPGQSSSEPTCVASLAGPASFSSSVNARCARRATDLRVSPLRRSR